MLALCSCAWHHQSLKGNDCAWLFYYRVLAYMQYLCSIVVCVSIVTVALITINQICDWLCQNGPCSISIVSLLTLIFHMFKIIDLTNSIFTQQTVTVKARCNYNGTNFKHCRYLASWGVDTIRELQDLFFSEQG